MLTSSHPVSLMDGISVLWFPPFFRSSVPQPLSETLIWSHSQRKQILKCAALLGKATSDIFFDRSSALDHRHPGSASALPDLPAWGPRALLRRSPTGGHQTFVIERFTFVICSQFHGREDTHLARHISDFFCAKMDVVFTICLLAVFTIMFCWLLKCLFIFPNYWGVQKVSDRSFAGGRVHDYEVHAELNCMHRCQPGWLSRWYRKLPRIPVQPNLSPAGAIAIS